MVNSIVRNAIIINISDKNCNKQRKFEIPYKDLDRKFKKLESFSHFKEKSLLKVGYARKLNNPFNEDSSYVLYMKNLHCQK